MRQTALVYDPSLADYDLGPGHPLRPERVTLSVSLMDAYGLLGEGPGQARVISPMPASERDLELVHSREYVEAVRRASEPPFGPDHRHGLGTGDNPVVPGMHEVSSLICGGAILGLEAVMDSRFARTFNVAGGLHHAHRDRAAGFCVYNDPAVAIAAAQRDHPGSRFAYVDIDAHHGDGVEEAFWSSADVLTVSVHESGRHLFPGTGFARDTGVGDGAGCALNVAMPPEADDECYALAFGRVIAPAIRAFAPDAIVVQCGADAILEDPLSHLGLSLAGYRSLVRSIVGLADEVCEGRIAACGGGGYAWWSAVPLAWTSVMAELLGAAVPPSLPARWREELERLSGRPAPRELSGHPAAPSRHVSSAGLLAIVEREIDELARHTHLLEA